MLENQENNQTVELTVDEKLANADESIRLLSATRVKPLLDILGLAVKGSGWYSGPTPEEVTVRRELEKLNELLTAKDQDIKAYIERARQADRKVGELEDYLDENWSEIDEEVREKLCEIFGIEENVTKSVSITITGTIDITAPRSYDWDNIGEDLNYDLDISLENSDLEQDGYGWSPDDFQAEAD